MPDSPPTFEAEVRSLSSDGSAVVSHPDGRVFFVRGAWPGDRAIFEIESFEKRYGIARLKELIKPAPERRESPCPYQGIEPTQCGGCPWMIADYASQTQHKEHRLRYALDRAKIPVRNFLPILASEELGYRNRAQFKTDGAELGFVSNQSKVLAPVDDCLVLDQKMRRNLKSLRGRLPNAQWKPSNGFSWNFIDADDDVDFEGTEPQLNRRRPFKQGNTAQNERMRAWITERLKRIEGVRHALELFCGSGNFTELLSQAGIEDILAVEVSAEALTQLEELALPGVQTLGSDLSKFYNFRRLADKIPAAQLLLLDPPREGAKDLAVLVKELNKLRDVLYISCDVATFVRDAKKLEGLGFHIEEIQPLDLFPQTPHVETLAWFRRS